MSTQDPKFLSTARKGDIMKKYLMTIALLATLLVGCSTNKKTDKVQEMIDYIITNTERIDKKNGYNSDYSEDDFSFKIYYDKSKDNYLIEAYIGYEGEPNAQSRNYEWQETKTYNISYDSDFNDRLSEGNYEVIYNSGLYDE